MNMNLGTYISKKGNLVLYSRHDGGGEVHIEKDDVAEVILWLASFQQGLHMDAAIVPPAEHVQNSDIVPAGEVGSQPRQ